MEMLAKIENCMRCGVEVARVMSRRTGKEYSTQIQARVTVGEDLVAQTDSRNFHECNAADVERFRATRPVVTYAGIVAFVTAAAAKGAKRIHIAVEHEGAVIAISYQAGRPVLYVTDGQPYGDNRYFGAISISGGELRQGRAQFTPAESALIAAFNANPAETAARSGKLSGRCSFCSHSLDDERSISHGYGPICAKKYALPWTAERTIRKARQASAAA